MKKNVFFVSGIDTNIGKSYATGYLARLSNEEGCRTITQKFIQTGNVGYSEDIDLHRELMGIPPTAEDKEGLTMPEIFSYPASPHLAARLDGREIDFTKMERATEKLSDRYDKVLLEGAGGLMVPLTEELLTIDYVAQQHYPLIFVTCGKLGSINHTLLSFEAIRNRGIEIDTVAYNLYLDEEDVTIQNDTEQFIRKYVVKFFPKAKFVRIPIL
ncbi:MAG: dethiobiotin synthase [Bacteroidaceae bacterium]